MEGEVLRRGSAIARCEVEIVEFAADGDALPTRSVDERATVAAGLRPLLAGSPGLTLLSGQLLRVCLMRATTVTYDAVIQSPTLLD